MLWSRYYEIKKEMNAKFPISKILMILTKESRNEVDNFFNASDLVVLQYREIYKSGVFLMALSYRRPVIVYNLPGLIEIIPPLP